MKNILYVFLVLILAGLIFFVFISKDDVLNPGFVLYENEELGYAIQHPEGWIVEETSEDVPLDRRVSIHPQDEEDFVAYITIFLDPRSVDLIQTVFREDVGNAWKEEQVTFAGKQAYQFTSEFSKNIFIPYDGRIYYIGTSKTNDPQIEAAIHSFKFE